MRHSILLIYTGGTIGMKTNPETGSLAPFDFGQIGSEVPELRKFGIRIETITFDPAIDSSNVSPAEWCRLAQVIRDNYEKLVIAGSCNDPITQDGIKIVRLTDFLLES